MASKIEILRTYLANADFDSIREYAQKHRRALSYLTALTYDPDSTISWRAVEALGLAASKIAERDPEYVRIHLRRLIWLLNDESGGIGWRAPEAIGEILYREPDHFSDFIPLLVNLIDMEPEDAQRFRAGWLWAVGRLAAVCPEEARAAKPWVTGSLADPDPQVRGMAIWCLQAFGLPIPARYSRALYSDQEQAEVYISPNLTTTSISELAANFSS